MSTPTTTKPVYRTVRELKHILDQVPNEAVADFDSMEIKWAELDKSGEVSINSMVLVGRGEEEIGQ